MDTDPSDSCCLRFAICASLVVMPSSLLGQNEPPTKEPPAFNSLRTPLAPAFVVLGVQPTSVEEPNTPAELAVSVFNQPTNFTSIPRNVAVEFSPYWMWTDDTAPEEDTTRGPLKSITRTASVSFATAEIDNSVTGIGVGLRTSLLSGSFTYGEEEETLAKTVETLNDALAALTDALRAQTQILLDSQSNEIDSLEEAKRTAARQRIAELAPQEEGLRNALKERRKQLDRRLTLRRGFQLEVAGGLAWEAPNAVFDSTDLVRWMARGTLAYAQKHWKAVGILRRLEERRSRSGDATDLGGRVIYASGDFGLSLEGVQRILDGRTPRSRVSGHVEYKLGSNWWLNVTVGNDFEDEAEGSLLSQFGLMFNFADARYLRGQGSR